MIHSISGDYGSRHNIVEMRFTRHILEIHCNFCEVGTEVLGARCWWRSWLRHYATSRKVAGSIPDGVVRIFHGHYPSGCTMALGSTQPLTEMSTRNISQGNSSWCVGLTTLPSSCASCLEIWEPQRPETLRVCQGL